MQLAFLDDRSNADRIWPLAQMCVEGAVKNSHFFQLRGTEPWGSMHTLAGLGQRQATQDILLDAGRSPLLPPANRLVPLT